MFCNVFAAWFVILVNELSNGTFSIKGSRKSLTFSHTRHWFIINHSIRTSPHNTKNHKKWINKSGNHSLSTIAFGNNSTIFQTHFKISQSNHDNITKNKTVGKINNAHVIKWFLFIFIGISLLFNINPWMQKLYYFLYKKQPYIFLDKKSLILYSEQDSFIIWLAAPADPIEII